MIKLRTILKEIKIVKLTPEMVFDLFITKWNQPISHIKLLVLIKKYGYKGRSLNLDAFKFFKSIKNSDLNKVFNELNVIK